MAQSRTIPKWLRSRRDERKRQVNPNMPGPDQHLFVTQDILGDLATYETSRAFDDYRETSLLRDVAFNNHEMNDGHHISPFDNGMVRVGADGIRVELVQKVDEESFKRVIGMATRATIGVNLDVTSIAEETAGDDWEEMMRGGLQTALEDAVVVFAVSGVSRTCTHQLVRTRNAAFHQQSQRASYYGDHPEARMPESVWLNDAARQAYMAAKAASDQAYRVACEAGISYQDARYVLLEGTDNYIMCEYNLREFIKVFDYRGCSMFSWEIVSVMRMMREVILEAHPWLEPWIKISCEKTPAGEFTVPDPLHPGYTITEKVEHKCTFQGWESVEGQCPFSWAKEANRTFQPKLHKIAPRVEQTEHGTHASLTGHKVDTRLGDDKWWCHECPEGAASWPEKRLEAAYSLRVNPNDLVCSSCGRDNRNGTHSALGLHLNHEFAGVTPEEYIYLRDLAQ